MTPFETLSDSFHVDICLGELLLGLRFEFEGEDLEPASKFKSDSLGRIPAVLDWRSFRFVDFVTLSDCPSVLLLFERLDLRDECSQDLLWRLLPPLSLTSTLLQRE